MATSDPRKRTYGFTADAGRRIQQTVRQVERSYIPDQRQARVTSNNPGVMRAKCTTAIPAGTFDSPSSSGEVQIYHLNQSTNAWEASGDPVQCWNDYDFGDDVAVGDGVRVSWISGQIWYENSDCGG